MGLIQAVTVFCSDYKTRGTSLTAQTRAKKHATSRDNDLSPNLGHHRHLPSASRCLHHLRLRCGSPHNICLTILGFLPGHVHAFYLIYVYYHKQEQASMGIYDSRPAPGVYSDNVNTGGEGYGSMGAR